MPKAIPAEFRRDVVAVARRGRARCAQVAKDFGISESCLAPLDQRRPTSKRASATVVTAAERTELRELQQADQASSSRRTTSCAGRPPICPRAAHPK